VSLIISKLTSDHHQDWDEYAYKKQASIYHNSRWSQLIKKVFGHESHYLMAVENEKVVGILPLVQLKSLLFGNFLISMPYFNYGGVVADTQETMISLISSAHELSGELDCAHIEMRFDSEQAIELPTRTDKITMLLDLPDDPEELWQNLGSKIRAQVKRPIREGVEFLTGGQELLDEFYYVFSINMRDLGTPVYSRQFFREMLSTFSENTFIAIVRLNGEPVGAGFLIGNNGKLEIPWASTLRKFNRLGVNMFMYWNILKTAMEKNYKVFDFGRSSKDAGTLKFKKQWGGYEKQLYWYYDLPTGESLPGLNPKNKKFTAAISAWKKLPVKVSNLIGPQIVKNLP
jgi:FemAB-related protein (PEP-CTERM system-associated)